ncbi:hypothetical protein B5P45_18695 [Phyllobacterium zundukense]|uniref:Uncharacterized protein n=2 Tax=Phyllobacterium zundukense TaxID=1867719 RepID=A0A2N9VV34_9HYPH|nr:hypothetical protein BLM14_24860 [Phyllobacterium zundukense]PIO43352.1 hypothetical protein B5P45_18695 [Phyllobacterium zundukense]
MSLTEAEQNVIRTALLDECGAEPLWVVGYGALSPTFDAVEARFATANWFNRQAIVCGFAGKGNVSPICPKGS